MRQWASALASLRADDRVAIAISGGSDSVALAWILHDVAPRASWRVVGLVHVNHGLRGDDAAADEAFCRDLAARLRWPIDVSHVDVRARARACRQSIETAARGARYECFEGAAARLGATVVATAHTMDDQAETVLLRLLRGAGSRGISGIRERRGGIVRPLLGCRRLELREFLKDRQELFREDASNLDVAIPRNRLRHELMPVIERLAPGGVAALARAAALAADDETELERVARAAEAALNVVPDQSTISVSAVALAQLPPAIARRVIRGLADRVVPDAAWAAVHIEAVRMLAESVESRTGGHLDLPGANVERRGDVLTMRPAGAVQSRTVRFDKPLDVPGVTDIPEAGARIRASHGASTGPWPPVSNGMVAVLDAAALALPLRVRSRQPGDRLRPLGSPGRRKLQDVLVDRKVPRDERDCVPIVVDAAGRIVWVAGLTVAEDCRATASGLSMVILELTKQ